MVTASGVYLFAHWDAITNQYVINDDVRQQIYWMQSWTDPGLYRDDILSRYARNYVPWGVQAVYALGSQFMNPVQFTKVVAGILFLATAGFLFGIGTLFKDHLTGVLAVCVFFLFGTFLDRMSGGLSRGFVYPLMAGYVYFLGKENLVSAGIMLLLQSLFNPYAFLVCLSTHVIFTAHRYAAAFRAGLNPASLISLGTLAETLPPAMGILLTALKYVVSASPEFGEVVTLADMAGKVEYTDAGRYGIVPVPSILFEIVRPWIPGFAPIGWETEVGAFVFLTAAVAAIRVLTWNTRVVDFRGFRVFFPLLSASVVLYIAARFIMMKLFLPSRYLEFSLNIFYCVSAAVCLRIVIERFGLTRFAFPLIASVLVMVGAVRLHGVGLSDYSGSADLYRFVQSTPKNGLIAGHPELMDNVTTFGKRKAFITYELSHTWYKRYWRDMSEKTFDFFRAYYADDPELIRKFCRKHGIDYLVVREEDFRPNSAASPPIYFEPFGSFIRDLVDGRAGFAVLDTEEFPPVFRNGSVRILRFD
ncbi:MAG: hypothetical protein V1792_16865 [Pseudomonadota bacterium]